MTDMMRAARFSAATSEMTMQDVPVPEPGPMEVLVKVDSCGVCLSDVHLLDGSIPPVIPKVTPGHESSGTVAAVGDIVTGWNVGDRVTIAGGRNCGKCKACRTGRMQECQAFEIMGFHYDGAWADFVAVPFYTLSPVPEHVPMEQAAILADAVATPYAALKDRARLEPGETVGLWGIGGLGTHAVQLARMMGAAYIVAVDPLPSARNRALAAGADVALDPREGNLRHEVQRLTGGDGLDVTLDLVGANVVLQQAVSCLGRNGRAVMVGLSMEPLELEPSILFGTLSHAVLGHLGYDKSHLDELVALLANGRLDLTASISEVLPLDHVADGVRKLAEKEGDPVRIVVKPV